MIGNPEADIASGLITGYAWNGHSHVGFSRQVEQGSTMSWKGKPVLLRHEAHVGVGDVLLRF